jgi:hypothetical protein
VRVLLHRVRRGSRLVGWRGVEASLRLQRVKKLAILPLMLEQPAVTVRRCEGAVWGEHL